MENGGNTFFQKEKDETGFSEEKLDKTIELQLGQWLDLPKLKNASKLSSSKPLLSQIQNVFSNQASSIKIEKILSELRVVNQDINKQLLEFMQFKYFGSDEAEKKLNTILDLQIHQRTLLKSLILVDRGDIDEANLPKKLQNLLK